ncbi:MAG TPA: condensation domain-containing protein, partial [Thermoanaerobaculia bacterium]|nr:condensation domain-containing protein [Thermoanaerobaculia bacterium]
MTAVTLSAKQRLLREQILRKERRTDERPRRIPRRADAGPPPLSFGQSRLWFLHQLDPASTAYNISEAVCLEGALDPTALGRALAEVARRHEVLRTVFPQGTGKEPVPTLAAAPALLLADLSGLPAGARRAEAARAAVQLASTPFDLERGPLLRAALLWLGPEAAQGYVLALALHHIVTDGWSMGLLMRELVTLYEAFVAGEPSPLPEPSLQYADFAAWQREHLSGRALERQLAYWTERLADVPTLLQLPTDRPWPAVQSFRGGKAAIQVEAPTVAALRDLARRGSATPFMTVLAALGTLLHRYSRQGEVLIGAPMANRGRPELEGIIGFFVNTLALPIDLRGDPSFVALIGRARETVLSAEAHQDLPFEQLVDALDLPRDLSRSPLIQVLLAYQNLPPVAERPRSLTLRRFGLENPTAQFDLNFLLSDGENGLGGVLTYRTDLFEAPTAQRLARHFEALLEGAALHPRTPLSELPLLTPAERHQILAEWNDTTVAWPEGALLHELFATRAASAPDALAATFEGEILTYAELAARTDRLARHLRQLGCGPESRVGVALERTPDLLVAFLGALQAGVVYVPLDPDYPRERLAYLLEDSRPAALLTQESLRDRLPIPDRLPVLLPTALPE